MKAKLLSAVVAFLLVALAILINAPKHIEASPNGVDLRQNGSIVVSGNLQEGGVVYLTIPVKNFGTETSPAMHVYTEGYTANNSLWRADGANPTGVRLAPGQSINITVRHDLWTGHAGWWNTYGVYIWNDDSSGYYGPLGANGYDQSIEFYVGGSVDLRQNGSIAVSGTLQEGGVVYLTIPVKNFGSGTSPAMHVYTEGYTSNGSLWRADGASPTAVQLGPGQSVDITVRHDLWSGHTGWWNTYGVYIWNDASGVYYGQLDANGYDQSVDFLVEGNVDLRQNGPISVTGDLHEGGIVYLTIPVKNFGSSTSPSMHVYTEGYTANGDLWRADGASPTGVRLGPGEIVDITVRHELWTDQVGWWNTYGVYVWNDDQGQFYGELNSNGYDQSIDFYVDEQTGTADLRLDGDVRVTGSLFQGEKVYLEIPIRNVGNTASVAIHPYTEGYTAKGALWRADGSQPTGVVIAPGERVVFTVQHDLWYEHVGTWNTYGIYLWNDASHGYYGQLNANEHDDTVEFNVFKTPLRSLDIDYYEDANRAIDIEYEFVDTLADGSVVVDLTIRNKTKLPYVWRISQFLYPDTIDGTLERWASTDGLPILPETTETIRNVRFPQDSYLHFIVAKFGFNDDHKLLIYSVQGISLVSTVVLGVYPTGDMFNTVHDLAAGELALFGDAVESVKPSFFLLGEALVRGDIQDAVDSLTNIAANYADEISEASGHLMRSKIPASAIKKLPYLSLLWDLPFYYRDLAFAPHVAEVRISPSSRPAESVGRNDTLSFQPRDDQASIVAVSSEQGNIWHPTNVLDGDPLTGLATGGESVTDEWIVFRLENNIPLLIDAISINPGPVNSDHIGSALKEFHVDVSMDGSNYTTVLDGNFLESELGQLKTFEIEPVLGEYVRIVFESNQSDNAVHYINLSEVSVSGEPYAPADTYEPDPSPEMALLLSPNLSTHERNFHFPGDVDWYRLEAVSNASYTFYLTTEASTSFEILDESASSVLFQGTSDMYTAFAWSPPYVGDFYIRMAPVDPEVYGAVTLYTFEALAIKEKLFLPIIQ